MEIVVNHMGAVQFEIKAGKNTIISDQPEDSGGFDEGMTPPELLLASLGSCAAYYAVDYLKRNNLLAGVRVRVTADKIKPTLTPGSLKPAGARIDNFKIEVLVGRELDDKQRQGVDEAVHRCLIHNTLMTPPKIETEIRSQVATQ